jgi:Protein of unknown function (DUF3619)
MINELNPGKIAQLLTQGTRQLDAATISALINARQNALKKQSLRASVFTLNPACVYNSVRWADRLIPHSAQPWVAGALLIAVLMGGTGYWQSVQEQQIDETDVAILTDELPIEVFVD